MFEFISKIFAWLFSLWQNLPQSAKDNIIKVIVDSFESVLRAFFKANKGDTSHA